VSGYQFNVMISLWVMAMLITCAFYGAIMYTLGKILDRLPPMTSEAKSDDNSQES
jgi:hypothetical protein